MAIVEIRNLEKAEKLLSGVKNGIERATASAVNRSITTIKKDLKKDVTSNYAIKSSEIENKLSVKKATFSNTTGYITSKAPLLSLHKFFSSKKADGTIYVRVKKRERKRAVKGKPYLFGKPFTATMENGHKGIFQRTGRTSRKTIKLKSGKEKSRDVNTIQDLKTVSIPQMLGTKSIQEYIDKKAPEILEKNMDREIERILKGYL